MESEEFKNILVEIHGKVGLIRLNRSEVLNALNAELMYEINAALQNFDQNDNIGCIVLTGNEKAFAAGADVKAMASYSYSDMYKNAYITSHWEDILAIRKPVIAAVAGYALGGGCELAMMCDFIIAAENARFGQPEIKLGTVPGIGGSQRLPRAVSKSKAMDLCLTGRLMDAVEAERAGLVSRIVPTEKLIQEALEIAATIAAMPPLGTMMIKELINYAYQSNLTEGVKYERKIFYSTFATQDQKEGMTAFLEKRAGNFIGK